MIHIIKATDSHLDTALCIRMEMLRIVNNLPADAEFDQSFVDASKEYFQNGNQTTLLAMDGEEAIGCATISYIYIMPTFNHPNGKRAHIMNVYTRDTYRRQGIAYDMMQMLIAEAKEKGCTELSLDATEAGRLLYERCGFRASEEGMILNLH